MTKITETREFLKTKGCTLNKDPAATSAGMAAWRVLFKQTGKFVDVATLEEAAAVGETLWDDYQNERRTKAEAEAKIQAERRDERERSKNEMRATLVSDRLARIDGLRKRANSTPYDNVPANRVYRQLWDKIESAVANLAGFREDFAADPLSALEWGEGTIQSAAVERVFSGLLEVIAAKIDNGEIDTALDAVGEICQREVLRAARDPSRSTNATSNLCDRSKAQAYAEALELLRWFK